MEDNDYSSQTLLGFCLDVQSLFIRTQKMEYFLVLIFDQTVFQEVAVQQNFQRDKLKFSLFQ